jgi:hypothetical protein
MGKERIYRRTSAGNKAWDTRDPNLPVEFLRILGVIGVGAHAAVICTSLRDYPEEHVSEWIANLEELGLIESMQAGPKDDLDFTGSFNIATVRAELERRAREQEQARLSAAARKKPGMS